MNRNSVMIINFKKTQHDQGKGGSSHTGGAIMSLQEMGRNKTLVHLMIFVFILLLSQQGIPAGNTAEEHEDEPSFKVIKKVPPSHPGAVQAFDQLLQEARRLYNEMDYMGAIQRLRTAEKLARTAMQKADVYFYLSLSYYATLEERDRSELVEALENVLIFDYLRELDAGLCPSGYIEIFQELRAGFGSLKVLSQPPGADVYVDRIAMGKTPLTIGAKSGQVKILVKRGKREQQDQLEVTAGQETTSPIYAMAEKKGRFPIALVIAGVAVLGGVAAFALKGGGGGDGGGGGTSTTGSIQVNSSPTGARIYLDGSDSGSVTNATLANIAAGSHTVRLVKEGYGDAEQTVSVTSGQTATVDLNLTQDIVSVTQPVAGATWTLGSSVTITWQVGASLSGQPQPVVSVPTQASLLNQHRLSARYMRASRFAAGMRAGRQESLDRSGRGKSLERQDSFRNFRGSQTKTSIVQDFPADQAGTTPPSPNLPTLPLQKPQTHDRAEVLDISNVKLELYKGGTLAEMIVSETENDGSHSWHVPTRLSGGSDYKVRVSCASDTSVYGESGNFTIASSAGTITVTQPASGAVWKKSLAYYIRWTSTVSGNVKIELYRGDNLVSTIKASAQNDGETQWTVPTSLADGSDYSILITSVETSGVSGRSANFTITHWYEFMTKWGTSGTGNGQFNAPWGIAVDNSGYVYVVDSGNNRVQKFTSSGAYVTKWGNTGSGNGQFNAPYGIAADNSGFVYIVDSGNVRVQQFSSTGNYLVQWTTDPNDWSSDPRGMAIYGSGILYITDFSNHHVSRFSTTGALLSQWGSGGIEDGAFVEPYGIAVDKSGSVYVADTRNHRVQKFTSDGAFLSKWGSQGSGDSQFSYPKGIAIDGSGKVYVVDSSNHRIQVFNSSGSFLTKWGEQGSGDGQFSEPVGLAFDSAGYMYIVDKGNNRIQKFRKVG
jgi:hypothetical protein